MTLIVRSLERSDLARLDAERKLSAYLVEQEAGLRSVHIAISEERLAGFVTLLWTADDPSFRAQGIPEISDLRVHAEFRGRGLGSALMDRVEGDAASRSDRVGLNVGLHSGYGAAQRLYVRRGYLPDGTGAVLEGEIVPEGATIRLDDDPIVTLRMTKDLRPVAGGLGDPTRVWHLSTPRSSG